MSQEGLSIDIVIVPLALIASSFVATLCVIGFQDASLWLCVDGGQLEKLGLVAKGLAVSVIASLAAGWLLYELKRYRTVSLLVAAPFGLIAMCGMAFVVAIEFSVWSPATTCVSSIDPPAS